MAVATRPIARQTIGMAVAAVVLSAAPPRAPAPGPVSDGVPVVVETPLGPIAMTVDTVRAPETAAYFLRYVDAGTYDGGRFLRTVRPGTETNTAAPIQLVQASRAPAAPDLPPLALEPTALRHREGALALARSGEAAVTSDFYICVGDDSNLDPGGRRAREGGAVFGQVTAGLSVVRRIQAEPIFPGTQALVHPVPITRVARARAAGAARAVGLWGLRRPPPAPGNRVSAAR